jgi:hypothetical protein
MSTQLKVGTFTKSLLIQIAREAGRFDAAGLEVEEVSVSSSPAQFAALVAGQLDVAITSPDNVIAYRFLSVNPLKQKLDVKILGAIDRGLGLSLCLSPNFQNIDQVQELTFAVDVPQSGFAFVGYGLLENLGFHPGDYQIQVLGATPKRAIALIDGLCATTILNAGNEIRAIAQGCTELASVKQLGPYIGTVVAAIPKSSGEYSAGTIVFAAILRETAQDILDGKLRTEVVNAAERVLGLTPIQGLEHYEVLLNPETGLIPNGKLDRESIRTLITLRERFLPTNELDSIMDSLEYLVVFKDLLESETMK